MEIQDKLKQLVQVRKIIGKYMEAMTGWKEEYEATDAYQNYLINKEYVSEYMEIEAALMDEIRDMALQLSKDTNWENRQPAPGVTIKRFEIIDITDEAVAKHWASLNAPGLLRLDVTKIKAAVKNLELPWITRREEYKAQIDTKLELE